MSSIFNELEIFNSIFFYNWFEDELFNHIADFFQHFQQCLHLYCESKLLDLLIIVFIDFVNVWFDDQSKFILLHDFDIVFTKTFFFSEFVTISSIFISSKSFISSKQQKLKITFEVSKIVKRVEFKKISKAKQTVKSTSTFQDIDIFDSVTCNESEFELYNVVANFLQNFQQYRHQYRKSDLLNLLSKCLCDFVFKWLNIQSKFTSLKRFNKILTKTFSEASVRRVSRNSNFQLSIFDVISKSIEISSNVEITNVRVICKLCKQIFNFNEKLYEHIRNHEALKLVTNSYLSINAINLVCEIKKTSFASRKSSVSFDKFQKSIFEFAIAFRTIILLKRSNFSIFTFETISKSIEIALFQTTEINEVTCRHCDEIFNFKKSLREHKREQHAKKSVICSFFLTNTVNSTCKAEKKSAIACSFSSQKSSTFFATFASILSKCSSFSIATFKITSKCTENVSEIAEIAEIFAKSIANIRVQIVRIRVKIKIERTVFQISTFEITSEFVKKFSIQQIVCARTCKRCKQNFNFNNKFHEHIRQHHARKSVKDFVFRVFTFEFAYKIVEKSTDICSSVSQSASFISFATSRSQIFSAKIVSRFISSNDSNFSIATHKITSKFVKIASINDFFTQFATFSSMFRKSISKSHFTIHDLFRMFVEKFKSLNLRQHHNRRFSQQNFDIRQFRSIKSHLIIENLFEMFDEKFRKKNLFQNQNNVSFQTFSNQMRIIVYFKFTVNQKSSISQDSKNSKSKSLNQHMFAKSIRIAFSKSLFETSIKLLYKMFDVFAINSKISFFIFILLRFLSIFFLVFAFVSTIFTARMNCINVY